jgi:hypothetical protein
MSDAATIVITVFIALIFGNFLLQFYVAYHLYGSSFLFKALRGTRTFIDGWKAAKAHDIQDLMVLWSILVAGMLIMICPVAYYGSQYDPDSTSSQNTNNTFQTRAPTPTRPIGERVGIITAPTDGQVLSKSEFDYFQVRGSVDYDRREVDYWSFWLMTGDGTQRAGFGERHFSPMPDANSELDLLPVSPYDPGIYRIAVRFEFRDGSTHLAGPDTEWIEIVITD